MQQGGAVAAADTAKAVLTVSEKYAGKEAWDAAMSSPKRAGSLWLQTRAKASLLDMRPPTHRAENSTMQVVVTISKGSLTDALKSSGADGVFVRPFFEEGVTTVHKTVPLPLDTSLDSALRTAQSRKHALGVITTQKGLGIRVLEADYDATVRLIHKENSAKFFFF